MINENLLYSTGTLPDALWCPKWERNPKKSGDIYIYIYIERERERERADLLCCTAETNTTL